jgi:hypothetical protein
MKISLVFLMSVDLFWYIYLAFLQLSWRIFFNYGLSPRRALIFMIACIMVGWGGVHYARFGGLFTNTNAPVLLVSGPDKGKLNPKIILVLEVPYAPAVLQARVAPADEAPGSGGAASAPYPRLQPAGRLDNTRSAGSRQVSQAVYAEPSPCTLDVNSLLYAIDVFIPVLDLDQERRCSIRHSEITHTRITVIEHGHRIERLKEERHTYWIPRFVKAFYKMVGWLVTSLLILILSGVLRRDVERRASDDREEVRI